MIHIRKWSETFENAKTRKLIHLSWLNCPSGVDSSGYLSLMANGEKGIIAFGVFIAICQWSATCRPVIRGTLARSDGKPLTDHQLAMILRMPVTLVSMSLTLLRSPEVNWLEYIGDEKTNEKGVSDDSLPTACQSSANHLPIICQSSPYKEGIGGDLDGEPSVSVSKRFAKPSISQLESYALELAHPEFDSEAFLDYYDSVGWTVGKDKPMKDWKAAVRTWIKRNKPKKIDRFAHWKLPIEEREALVKQEMYSP